MKRIILFLCALVFSFISNTGDLSAKEIGNNLEDKTSIKTEEINIDKNKKSITSETSIEDIFGDEQTFPFVAGLGKNAAH